MSLPSQARLGKQGFADLLRDRSQVDAHKLQPLESVCFRFFEA